MAWTPYYDEDGAYHNDDPNIHTTCYKCSEGHIFRVQRQLGVTTLIMAENTGGE